MKIIEISTLHELLEYNADTGKFTWKPRDRKWFKTDRSHKWWNTNFSNKEAFTAREQQGYHTGSILGVNYKAHRVAYAMYHGTWPEHDIDHENGIRDDNRIENLVDKTRSENLRNSVKKRDHKTHGNITLTKQNTFHVQIWHNGKYVTNRRFKTEEAALEHRDQVKAQYGFSKRHGT